MSEIAVTPEGMSKLGLSKDVIRSLEDVFERLEMLRRATDMGEEVETALFAIAW